MGTGMLCGFSDDSLEAARKDAMVDLAGISCVQSYNESSKFPYDTKAAGRVKYAYPVPAETLREWVSKAEG